MAAAASWAHSIGRSAVVPVTKQQEKTGERALGQDSLVEELLTVLQILLGGNVIEY